MTDSAYLLQHAHIINENKQFQGDLLIDDGIIQKIFPGGSTELQQYDHLRKIDLRGMWLMPGVIDDQVHFREPGLTHKADLFTESRAAVAGGITSFMEMPNTSPQTTTQALLEEKFRLGREKSMANFSFYFGATNDNLDEIKGTDPDNVCGIKVFMGSSTGNMLVDNPDTLEQLFKSIRLPIAVHCEDESIVRRNLEDAKMIYGEAIPTYMHPAIRSREACYQSSRMAISLAEKFDTRLHLLHLSTRDEVRLLNNNQPLADKRITAEVCVHHLWYSLDDYASKGPLIKWNPAVKNKEDRRALIEAIREGYIDVVATDHAPHTLEEKQQPYLSSPSGGPMVQHALPAMLTLASKHKIPVPKVVELMCHHPAICFGIKNRGFIREGYAADLTVVDPGQSFTVDKEALLYKCKWSPMEGEKLQASVMYTIVNGHIVYQQGAFDEAFRGQPLQFSR